MTQSKVARPPAPSVKAGSRRVSSHPHLFAGHFDGASWQAWRVILKAMFGLPLAEDDAAFFRRVTQREGVPTRPARELWAIVGLRGGKSRVAALLAVWLGCFKEYTLTPGERGVLMVLAADRRQARVVLGYIVALIDAVPMLSALVERRTADAIHLKTGISIEVYTASFRSVRGYTVIAAICDEIAFWRTDESANPDTEILNALRPAMATVPGSILVCISSPYARRGELWKAHRQHYGQDSDMLVIQAETRTMNPTIRQDVIDRAYAEDDAVASAEYGAQFRRDIDGFISAEAIAACVTPGLHELSFMAAPDGPDHYVAFTDPSGGSRDSFTLAIGHEVMRDAQPVVVIDCLRETRPPFSPEAVVTEYAALLTDYEIVIGDRYAGEWPREQFRKRGITYELARRPKSELYRDALALLNSEHIELLDHGRLIAQLGALERRTTRGGRDSIDHAPGGHDDLANVVCGVAVAVLTAPRAYGVGQALTDDAGPIVLTLEDAERELARRRAARAALRTRSEVRPVGWVTAPIEDEPGGVLSEWDPWATERPE